MNKGEALKAAIDGKKICPAFTSIEGYIYWDGERFLHVGDNTPIDNINVWVHTEWKIYNENLVENLLGGEEFTILDSFAKELKFKKLMYVFLSDIEDEKLGRLNCVNMANGRLEYHVHYYKKYPSSVGL